MLREARDRANEVVTTTHTQASCLHTDVVSARDPTITAPLWDVCWAHRATSLPHTIPTIYEGLLLFPIHMLQTPSEPLLP